MDLIRADQLLVKRKKAESRSEAAELIRRGSVRIGVKTVLKPGSLVPADSQIEIPEMGLKFVSRGGEKLHGALEHFKLDLEGKIALDSGASTGGFTDCLLKHGVKHVFAVDVGYGQLHWKLRKDPRVTVLERTNVRYITPAQIPVPVDIVTLDLSFISVRLVLDSIKKILADQGIVLILVKPQFEAGKGKVGRKGVIRNPDSHFRILLRVAAFLAEKGWNITGMVPSDLVGPKGNREFFFLAMRMTPDPAPVIEQKIHRMIYEGAQI